ncbi:MAG: glyoxylase-like metal-dependent hydrolase (beta-lactamase superfamily II) [Halieaceae bacterium]|jgi:glyoxylase-like metal-dependent hydrolase (beta-lactamase superfamily II)
MTKVYDGAIGEIDGDIIPGERYQLTERVARITAPNPGIMTGPGTNTYLLGHREIALVDPGPLEPAHVDALLDACGDRLRWIIATHTHPDHSPAWAPLAEASGAQVIGATAQDKMFQDETFVPDIEVTHDWLLKTDEFTLRGIHTPGHVGNHFCYLIEEEGVLLTGDHIMNGSTVVIVPPSGDMKAYIESLQLLLDYPLQAIAPGHGKLMDNPEAVVQWIVDHRLQRERKVVERLGVLGECDLDTLVVSVYDDVDKGLHSMAKLSLCAHLIKLQKEARVSSANDRWVLLR